MEEEIPATQVRLIWIDLEMTGLNPDVDRILEIATVVTDGNLMEIARGPTFVITQSSTVLNAMNSWCKTTHDKTGLLQEVYKSSISEQEAEQKTLDFLTQHVQPQTSPMCGNTVSQDRRFLIKYMPKLADFFHYRHIDVSSIKLLAKIWYQYTYEKNIPIEHEHRALIDILHSIEELKAYRTSIFK